DRRAVRLAPDQIPVLPGLPRRLLRGVQLGEVLAWRRDELSGDRHSALALALRPRELPSALPQRACLRVALAVRRAELRALAIVGIASLRALLAADVLAPRCSLCLRAVRRARVDVVDRAARVRVLAAMPVSVTLELPVHLNHRL